MTGIELIAAERKRQIEQEGWTPEHDAQHGFGDLSRAAAAYALNKMPGPKSLSDWLRSLGTQIWPWNWNPQWDKREKHDRKRSLVIAGALIAAEIDRIQAEEAK